MINNYVTALARPQNRDQFVLRMDYVESSKSTWAGRYSWGDENESSPGLNLNGTKLVTNLEQYMGSNTRVFSPTVVSETRFGYTRFYNSVGTLLAFQRNVVDELGIPGLKGGDPVSWGIPSIGIANYNGIGDGTDGPFENKNSTLQFLNNTSVTQGQALVPLRRRDPQRSVQPGGQSVRAGQLSASPQRQRGIRSPHAQGDAFASFLLGNVTLTEVAAQIASVQFRATSFSVYFDDVWKVSPKVTMSLGLRYENTPPWEDISGNLTTVFYNAFDSAPNLTDQSRYPVFLRQGKSSGDPYAGLKVRWPNIPLVQDGRLGNRLVNRDNNDFAPRLGLAWSPNSKWAIRTGAGMFYNQDQGNPRFDVGRNAAGRTRNDDNPDFPAETWLNGAAGLVGFGSQHPDAAGLLQQVRSPHAVLDAVAGQRAARTRQQPDPRSRLRRFDQPPPRVVSRRQRGGSRTRYRCQPLSLSELRPARAGRKRRKRQLQLDGVEADQALLEWRHRAGILHLVEIHR